MNLSKPKTKLLIILSTLTMLLSLSAPCVAALSYQQTYASNPPSANTVLLAVNADIYNDLYASSLRQYMEDLEAEGYGLIVIKFISGTPSDLKAYLQSILNLKGAIFIGNIPVAKFEIYNDPSNGNKTSSFPCDLFYMNLNGKWQDWNNNGYFDHVVLPISDPCPLPYIWLGRIMGDANSAKAYFDRNHKYRTGGFTSTNRGALAFVAADSSLLGTCDLALAYPRLNEAIVVNTPQTATMDNYRLEIQRGYEWVQLVAHSDFDFHAFSKGTTQEGWAYSDDIQTIKARLNLPLASPPPYYSFDIRQITLQPLFYALLNSCLGCRYTEKSCIGCNYVFGAKTNGLFVIGLTKTGGGVYYQKLYQSLGPGYRKTMGQSFKDWYNDTGRNWPSIYNMIRNSTGVVFPNDFNVLHQGIVLLGDPTLSLDPPVAQININSSKPYLYVYAGEKRLITGSGRLSSGNITAYNWRSNIAGFLGNGNSIAPGFLPPGLHTVYFKVKDDKERWSSEAKITVNVVNFLTSK